MDPQSIAETVGEAFGRAVCGGLVWALIGAVLLRAGIYWSTGRHERYGITFLALLASALTSAITGFTLGVIAGIGLSAFKINFEEMPVLVALVTANLILTFFLTAGFVSLFVKIPFTRSMLAVLIMYGLWIGVAAFVVGLVLLLGLLMNL